MVESVVETKTSEIYETGAPLQDLRYVRAIYFLMGFQVLQVLLAGIQYQGGIYNGGISSFFTELSKGDLFSNNGLLTYMVGATLMASVSFGLLIIAIYYRENFKVQQIAAVGILFGIFGKWAFDFNSGTPLGIFGTLMLVVLMIPVGILKLRGRINLVSIFLTLTFAFSVTTSFGLSTNNFVLMFFTATFLPAVYYYWMINGEFTSFFDNRVIIFSFRRSLAIVPMFIAISLFTFVAINLIGNPVELATARVQFAKDTVQATLLRQYGLTDSQGREIPVWKRYLNWIYDFIHGDMGQSYEKFPSEVTDNLGNFLWETLKMQVLALVLAFTISVVIGILAAYFHKTPADSIISAIALLGLSMPIFVSGILAIIIFTGTGLQWFPAAGAHSLSQLLVADGCLDCARPPDVIWDAEVSTNWTDPAWWSMFVNVWWIYSKDSVRHLVLPVATLTFATMATFARLTRSTMLEIMRQDYILAARANGLSEYTIVRKHALKNVLLPLVTFLGLSIGGLLIGAPITETVFSFPGLGNYFLASLRVLDVPIIMALTMIITLMILFSNLAADIAYTYLDPRIAL